MAEHRRVGTLLDAGRAAVVDLRRVEAAVAAAEAERISLALQLDNAERELIKVKLLTYMSERIGSETDAIITGVADYGVFAQAEPIPVEGLVHISTLTDDYYYYEESTHSLTGSRTNRRFRLGDRIRVTVVRVDLQRRQLDFRVVPRKKRGS